TPCPVGPAAEHPGTAHHHVPVTDAGRLPAPATIAVTAGRPSASPDAPLNEAVAFASAYHAGGPVAYARDGNPNWSALEDALGRLEGGDALAFASGTAALACRVTTCHTCEMGAITSVVDTLPVGAKVVAPVEGYNGTRRLLRDASAPGRWDVHFADIT